MTEPVHRYIIAILAQDRVGIVADVSDALYQKGANLEAISQTVVQGWFTMTIRAAFPEEMQTDGIRTSIEAIPGLSAQVQPFGHPTISDVSGEPYVATVTGKDKPGIVRGLTRVFAQKGVNLEDIWNEVRDGQFVVIFQILLPAGVDPRDLRYELEQAAQHLGMRATLQHQHIFTATNTLAMPGH